MLFLVRADARRLGDVLHHWFVGHRAERWRVPIYGFVATLGDGAEVAAFLPIKVGLLAHFDRELGGRIKVGGRW